MANYIEALSYTDHKSRSLFMAGGIVGCFDWQQELWQKLKDLPNLTIYNPRRTTYLEGVESAKKQIAWEFHWLERCDAISFWFAAETIQPIVLLEFGRWSASNKKLFIGCHPDYPRRLDVEIQLSLIRPEHKIHYSLNDLAKETGDYYA